MKNYTQIDGWFNYEKTFDFLVSKIPDGGVFVECGAWLGKSSSYLCDMAKDRITINIVDNWTGSINELTTTQKLVQSSNIYDLFIQNMGKRKFNVIINDGVEASKQFNDNSCDVVFIDMEHTYNAVKQDILSWLPKVKIGGYIAGHDYTPDWQGVIDAVNEIFGKKNIINIDTCWIYKKENK